MYMRMLLAILNESNTFVDDEASICVIDKSPAVPPHHVVSSYAYG